MFLNYADFSIIIFMEKKTSCLITEPEIST